MSPSKSTSRTKKYVLLQQPTLLKNKSLSKQGKEITTTKSPSQWVAMYAMAVYSKKYKQLRSAFLYRKGTVYRYNITFKTKSGKRCATAKLTSRSVCKVSPGKVGKSRSCKAHGAGPQTTALSAKKKSLAKSKSDVKKARKSLTSIKKRVAKAKQALCKTKSGTKKRAAAKKKVTKASKQMATKKKSLTKLKAAVKKKSKEVTRMSR